MGSLAGGAKLAEIFPRWPLRVICQLCDEVIASTTLDALSYPIIGSMFQSPDPVHGVPDPWMAYQEWEDMRCPFGRTHRGMVGDDLIKTDCGMVQLSKYSHPHLTPAYFTDGIRVEIGRESIIDRVIMVPDDEAEKQVRAELAKGLQNGKTEAGAGKTEDGQPVEGKEEAAFTCAAADCGRSFKTKQALIAHGRSHRRVDVPNAKALKQEEGE